MNKMVFGMTVLMMLSGFLPLFAQDAVLAKAELLVPGDEKNPLEAVKVSEKGEIFLKIQDKAGKEVWKSESLGIEDRNFWFEKESKPLLVVDLNGDKTPEILISAFIGPKSTGLYVFQFDPKAKKAVAFTCKDSKDAEPRDSLIADIESADGSNFRVTKDGKAVVAGMVYEADKAPSGAEYFFALKDKVFELEKTEKLPEPADEKKDEKKEEKKEEKK